ncbi:hypothetical protein ACHAPJ_011823 [Fusarium lateritium]
MSELPKKYLDEESKKDVGEETMADIVENGTVEAFGYGVSYRRVLKTFANVCWVIALTAPTGAVIIMAQTQMIYGGYWGLTCSANDSRGWVLPSFVLMPQVLAIAELCSSMPLNGATYWWTAALAPPKWSRFLSFVSGCTTVLSLFTSVASYAYASSSIIIICVNIYSGGQAITAAQQMAVAMGIVVLWIVGLRLQLDKIGWIMVFCTVVPVVQTLVFIVGLPVTHSTAGQPFASASDVFGNFKNYSDWTPGAAIPFTWFAAAWGNSAWIAPAYIVEGTHDARRSTPKSMITSFSITATMGIVLCIIASFCITDMDTLAVDPSGFPLVTLLLSHWGQAPTFVFVLAGTIATIVSGCGWLLAYAFQLSAFARDGGLPFSKRLSYVHENTNTPVYAALTLATGSILILLLSLSGVARTVIYSLAVIVALLMMSLPVGLRLFAGDRWVPGPWNLGKFSILVHAWALLAQFYIVIMESFPSTAHWTAASFNYNWVVSLAAILISMILYCLFGSHYKGIDLEALDRFRNDNRDSLARGKGTEVASCDA